MSATRFSRAVRLRIILLKLVDNVRLNPRRGAEGEADAQRDGEARDVDEGKRLGPELSEVVLVGKVRPVAGRCLEAEAGHRNRKAPEGPLPEDVGDDARSSCVLDF